MSKNIRNIYIILLSMTLLLSACFLPSLTTLPTATSVPPGVVIATATSENAAIIPSELPPVSFATLTPTYGTYPGEPSGILSAVKDETFPSTFGDDFTTNIYERPFQLDNTYRPDADIAASFISMDEVWYYFSTEVVDINPATKTLDSPVGFEIDFDRDGRGDFLLLATPPFAMNWTTGDVQVYVDTNRDVGNRRPILSDAPPVIKSDGYETVLIANGSGPYPETAWARQSPSSATTIQIAVLKKLINKDSFLWWAWTDFDLAKAALFDYNDSFTAQEAGSPYAASPYFPLKALFGMDNTCRVAFGFTPVGNEPGLCGAVQPTSAPATAAVKTLIPINNPTNTLIPPKKPTNTPKPPPPVCSDIQIAAQVTDGSTWDPSWAAGVTLCIGGNCKNPDSSGYAIWYLPAGTYTIKASSPAYGIHPDQATTKKGCGEKDLIQFVIGPG
jgi:hypothetical protein